MCGAKLAKLGIETTCQLRPDHTGAHWGKLTALGLDGVAFWEYLAGGLSIDVSLYGEESGQ